ncbi:DUF3592 domain-containing protein [Euzebya sp.]|uniref:DUF3592 domain-containing protein n=1 Tax=Euzebya sp. TaxID=1971409 RepID=UPI0035140DEA
MKTVVGVVLSAVAGASFAYGITEVIDSASLERCFAGCAPPTAALGAMGAGFVLFIVSAFTWGPRTWFVAPPVGLVTALVLALGNGVELTGSTLGWAAFIALSVLAGPLLLGAFVLRGRAKAKQAAHLVATGQRAVAHVQGARQTGVYINNQPQVRVDYLIRPLDGSAPFGHQKAMTIGYAAIPPRPGLLWPAWYDPADPSKVAIGAPSGQAIDAQTEATLREFGISLVQAFGYDPRGGQPAGWGTPPPIVQA